VTVADVAAGGPAEKAGVRKGDAIVAANDQEIRRPGDLVRLVQNSKPGDKIALSVRRAGEEKPIEIAVTLGENPDKPGAAYMGVSLGQSIGFERIPLGSEGRDDEGFEIIPGFRLPFGFGDLPSPFPSNPDPPEMNRRAA
jgi:C-terminal processing protease CtpA/Prc